MAFGVPDPVGEPLVARRQTLAASAVLQLPRPGNPACPSIEPGPCRGGQVEGTVFHDVTLDGPGTSGGRARATPPFSAAQPIARSFAAQRNVALAAKGRRAIIAWEEGGHVRLARSSDGGRTWTRPQVFGAGSAPSIAMGARGRVWLAMAERRGVVAVWTSHDGGRRFGNGWEASPGQGRQLAPSIAATTGGNAYLAWIDERGRQPDGSGLARAAVYGAPVRDNRVGTPRLLDTAPAKVADAKSLDNDWAVSAGSRGRAVTVAWADFSTYDWRIVARSSRDGGRRFGALRTISANPADREALDDAPSVAVGRRGAHVAWTNYTKAPTLDPAPSYQVALDRRMLAGDAHAIAVNPALALTPSGTPLVAFQDHADGVPAIRLSAGGRSRAVSASAAGQWRPAIAVSARHVLVAWADARGRSPQIRLARAPLHAVI
jgi:hypothetical protein